MSKYCFYVFRPPPPLPLPPLSGLGSTPRVTISTLPYPLLTKKIKDGGYGVTNLNKEPSLAPQNTPALQPRF